MYAHTRRRRRGKDAARVPVPIPKRCLSCPRDVYGRALFFGPFTSDSSDGPYAVTSLVRTADIFYFFSRRRRRAVSSRPRDRCTCVPPDGRAARPIAVYSIPDADDLSVGKFHEARPRTRFVRRSPVSRVRMLRSRSVGFHRHYRCCGVPLLTRVRIFRCAVRILFRSGRSRR